MTSTAADAARRSSTAYLKISVNDERVGRVKLGPEGTNFCVCLPSSLMAGVMKESDGYLMALKIERDQVSPFAGDVKFDYLTLGGPWQIGLQNDSNAELGEMGSGKGALHRYHVAAWDDTKCARSTYTDPSPLTKVYAPQKIYFTLSAEEASDLDLTFSYRSASYNTRWKLVVNGSDYDTRFFDSPAARQTYSWTFPKGTLVEGINCVELAVPKGQGLNQYNNHDMFSFAVADFHPGSLHTGPLGLGTKIIFR